MRLRKDRARDITDDTSAVLVRSLPPAMVAMVAMVTPDMPVVAAVMLPPAPVHLRGHVGLLRGGGLDRAEHGRGGRSLGERSGTGKRYRRDGKQPDASHVSLLVANPSVHTFEQGAVE
jgi:hypothetical protein